MFLLETGILPISSKKSQKCMNLLNDHHVHFITTLFPLWLPCLLNNHYKNGYKNRCSYMVTRLTTIMTYNRNSWLNYDVKSRKDWTVVHIPESLFHHVIDRQHLIQEMDCSLYLSESRCKVQSIIKRLKMNIIIEPGLFRLFMFHIHLNSHFKIMKCKTDFHISRCSHLQILKGGKKTFCHLQLSDETCAFKDRITKIKMFNKSGFLLYPHVHSLAAI